MRCYGFGFAGSLQHEELGEDGDGFEPDGEGPEDLCWGRLERGVGFFCGEGEDWWLGGFEGGGRDAYFCDLVFVREEDSENGAAAE